MSREKIVIVDDEYDIRNSITEYLADDYECLTAETGLEALQIVKSEKVDLIITDFTMPDLDGLELIRSLHEISAEVPVIVMTGRGTQDLHIKTLAFNVFEYIEKPFHFKELRSSVAKCLMFYRESGPGSRNENIFSKAGYEELSLKLPKQTAALLKDHCQQQGLSVAGFIDKLVNEILSSRKAG